MLNPTGAARTQIDIIDYSILIDTALKGKTAFLGVTERGKIGNRYQIGSWEQYKIELGDLIAGEDFPLYCKRALDAGAPLEIIPAGKYSDPSNKATLSGVKATYSGTQSALAAAGATATNTLNSVSIASSANVFIIAKIPGRADVVIANAVALTSSDTKATTVTAILAAINGGTGTHGFSATGSTTTGVFSYVAPAAYGAWGRNIKLTVIADTGVVFDNYYPVFTGGNDTTTTAGTLAITAYEKGAKYNDVVATFKSAASNDANKYDIVLSLTNSSAPDETITDVPKLASDATFAGIIAGFVANSRLVSAMAFATGYVLQPGVFNLTGGTNGTAMVAADYVGDRAAQTNMYAFDTVVESPKICIPAIADPTLAKALADYADTRQDVIALHRVPIGITTQRVLDYRYGTGTYSHPPIDSWRSFMFSGDITVTDPRTALKRDISPIADVVAAMANKDVAWHEWFSFAGETRGLIKNVENVTPNLGIPGLVSFANDYDRAGIIPVVFANKHFYIDGDNTLYMHDTLLKASNVAELLVFMYRSFKGLLPKSYDPNDVEYWKEVYRKVQPWLQYLKDGRAIWDYTYQGDENVMDVSQAKVNKPVDIDKGLFKAFIGIKPKRNAKYINFTLGVFNSGFNFNDITFS